MGPPFTIQWPLIQYADIDTPNMATFWVFFKVKPNTASRKQLSVIKGHSVETQSLPSATLWQFSLQRRSSSSLKASLFLFLPFLFLHPIESDLSLTRWGRAQLVLAMLHAQPVYLSCSLSPSTTTEFLNPNMSWTKTAKASSSPTDFVGL